MELLGPEVQAVLLVELPRVEVQRLLPADLPQLEVQRLLPVELPRLEVLEVLVELEVLPSVSVEEQEQAQDALVHPSLPLLPV